MEELRRAVYRFAVQYHIAEEEPNTTNENRVDRYYKKVHNLVRDEIEKARREGFMAGQRCAGCYRE